MRVGSPDEYRQLTGAIKGPNVLLEELWRGNADGELGPKPEGGNGPIFLMEIHEELVHTPCGCYVREIALPLKKKMQRELTSLWVSLADRLSAEKVSRVGACVFHTDLDW